MNPIYLRLFDGYAADILQKADPFDSKSVEQLADKPLDQLDVPALEALWRQAKARERQEQPQG